MPQEDQSPDSTQRHIIQLQKGENNFFVGGDNTGNVIHQGVPNSEVHPSARQTQESAVPRIFLCHTSEEKPLLQLLKCWIEETFQERVSVFIDDGILAGDLWFEQIEIALEASTLMLVVTSRQAFKSHWVHFEVGFAWARGIPIVFLCHTDITVADLFLPYSKRQSMDISGDNFPRLFLAKLAEKYTNGRLPQLDYAQMAVALNIALAQRTSEDSRS